MSFADDDGVGEGTVSSDNGKRAIIKKELALEALKFVANRCQFGDDSDKCIQCGCDNDDAANCNDGRGDSKSTTLETLSVALVDNILSNQPHLHPHVHPFSNVSVTHLNE
mmetsp:Transcript_20651/g.43765  ORF Transcript_20651/g.43765 Transcript_20651/m.43765 type:complete len:110 (+) Transcript_20651:295-624(+)